MRIWKGDVLVADLEELETMDASEIYSKRLNAKEVIFPKEKGEFIFPIADGRINPLGGDQDLRTSTWIRQRPNRGESHLDFLGESEGSLPKPHDSFPSQTLLGQVSFNLFLLEGKTSRRIYVVRGEINKKTADIQARSFMARTLEDNGKECQAEGEAKVV